MSWKAAAIPSRGTATAMTSGWLVRSAVNWGAATRKRTAPAAMNEPPAPNATRPARRVAGTSRAPIAWPTRTAAAAEMPNGTMKVRLARVRATWWAARFHNSVGVDQSDRAGLERLARYFLRSPVSLQRLSWDESTDEARYALKATPASQPHDAAEPDTAAEETLSGLELLARIITHIPEPRHHLARYYGAYSAVSRARRRRDVPADSTSDPDSDTAPHTPADSTAPCRNRLWPT